MTDLCKANLYLDLLKVVDLRDILKTTPYNKADKKSNLVNKILELLRTGTQIINAEDKATMCNKIEKYTQKYTSAKNSKKLTNITNIIPYSSETTLAGPLIHADVRLKFSPFSEKLWTFIEPSSLLIINSRAKEHSRCFSFNFGPQQLEDLKTSIDTTVELRFCLLNSSCEQSDNFPKNLRINVNGKLCVLPNLLPNERGKPPAHIPGPVNISCYLNCSTSVPNVIWCDWTSEANRVHVISCFLTRKVSSTHLLNELKIKSGTNINETTALIKEKMNETDAEIATTSLRVSLVCPLGKMRMITPCRATTCLHLQCFDAALYLEMNEMKQTFICPVCDKKALYENLVIDEYFQQVLNSSSLSADDHDIELKKDGSWTKCCDKIVIFNLDLSQESQSKLDDNSAIVLIPYIDCELLPKKSCNVTSEFIDLTVNTPVKPTTHRRTRSSTTVDLTFGDSDN